MEKINFIPSINNVDFHKDYPFDNLDCFGVDKGNRNSSGNVKDYFKKMKDGKWFFELPLVEVGIKSLNILNGEHRRKAYNMYVEKTGNKPIVWVRFVDDSGDIKALREALNGGKHWNAEDYISAHINEGHPDFIALYDFAMDKDHGRLHGEKKEKNKPYYAFAAIALGSTRTEFKKGYLTGNWSISRSDYRRAEQTYSEMVRIKKCVGLGDAGHDFWLNIGEAWQTFYRDKATWDRVKALNNGIEDFYDALMCLGTMNTYHKDDWYERYIKALELAESKQ